MHPMIIVIFVFASLSSRGFSEESIPLASPNHESMGTLTSSSRSKRGYDFRRLGRGLQMLRLGKRGGAYSMDDDQDVDDVLPFTDNLYYGPYMPEDQYQPRFRRSTLPTGNIVAPPVSDNAEDQFPELGLSDDLDSGYFPYPVVLDTIADGKTNKRQLDDLRTLNVRKRILSKFNQDKRQLQMLRLGKREGDASGYSEDTKRNLNMLRLGKRGLEMLRLGKRPYDDNFEDVKRNLAMLRLGKRNLNMLRLGKREQYTMDKKNLAMLRLGKREDDVKRNLNMLRLGKRPMESDKRNLNMLRLGKREDGLAEKRNLNMLRLGKRSADSKNSASL